MPVNGKGCVQDFSVALMDFENKKAFGMNSAGTLSERNLYPGEQPVLTLAFVNNPIDFNMKA